MKIRAASTGQTEAEVRLHPYCTFSGGYAKNPNLHFRFDLSKGRRDSLTPPIVATILLEKGAFDQSGEMRDQDGPPCSEPSSRGVPLTGRVQFG